MVVTGEMKETFNKFPEVLMVDGTYRVNKLKMPLYNFLVEDGHGLGRLVGFSLLANEKKDTIECLMSEFSKIHDVAKVKCIVVDKDLNEISALKKIAPNSSIQICKFHVMQSFTREIRKLPEDETTKKKILQQIKLLVYARSQSAYEKNLDTLMKSAPKKFTDYFHKNWHPIKEMWCGYLTNSHMNLGNTTNNRIESFNQKVKAVLDHQNSLAEALRGLLLLVRTSLYAVEHRAFTSSLKVPYHHNESDADVSLITRSLTPYAANIVLAELNCARSNVNKLLKDTCICILKTTVGLPCKHIFAQRIFEKTCLFSLSDVLERWLSNYNTSLKSTPENLANSLSISRKKLRKTQTVPSEKNEKYRDIMFVCKEIADLASSQGTNQFAAKLETLEILLDFWKNGQTVLLTTTNLTSNDKEVQNEVADLSDTDSGPDNSLNTLTNEDCSSINMDIEEDLNEASNRTIEELYPDEICNTSDDQADEIDVKVTEDLIKDNQKEKLYTWNGKEESDLRKSLNTTDRKAEGVKDSKSEDQIKNDQNEKSYVRKDELDLSDSLNTTDGKAEGVKVSRSEDAIQNDQNEKSYVRNEELDLGESLDTTDGKAEGVKVSRSEDAIQNDQNEKSYVRKDELDLSESLNTTDGKAEGVKVSRSEDAIQNDQNEKSYGRKDELDLSESLNTTDGKAEGVKVSRSEDAIQNDQNEKSYVRKEESDLDEGLNTTDGKAEGVNTMGTEEVSCEGTSLGSSSPIFKSTKKRKITHADSPIRRNDEDVVITGVTPKVLRSLNFNKFKLPTAPPVRGKPKVKRSEKNRENVFQSRQRKMCKGKINKSGHTQFSLNNSEIGEIQNGGMLNDKHIKAALDLIKEMNPSIEGLQDPILGSKLQFDVSKGKFIQILHDGCIHWITVSNILTENIDIFDSLYRRVTESVKMQIASICMCEKNEIQMHIRPFQKQRGGTDCGLFAIASAVTLSLGRNPSHYHYEQALLRSHLVECFNKRQMSEFPAVILSELVLNGNFIRVPVYCVCRLPDNKQERMICCINCNEWYHQTCLSVSRSVFEDKNLSYKWICSKCTVQE